ncbi:hypothetical protein PG991_001426, partial [Apiospora marii]
MAHSFRVIVVGGGVAGLAASHILSKAGIEHVVLERRATVAPQEGASIAIYPNGSRILYQVGALEAVQKHCVPPGKYWLRMPDSTIIGNNNVFRYLEENHGSGLLLIERRQFLQELYDTLPDKTRVRTSCAVRDVRAQASGVEVTLENGEVEKGDLVLGCDGVYSTVRTFMWDQANKISPGLITAREKRGASVPEKWTPFSSPISLLSISFPFADKEVFLCFTPAIRADWKSLIVMTTDIPELGTRDLTIVHNDNYSHMFTMTPQYGYFFVFFRLDEPCIWPHRPRYTDQDAQDLANKIASHPVSETMVFGEVWKHRIRASVVNLEEGVLDHWYNGRIALAGDAVHKVTPNMAFGGNSSIESVAVLANHLRRMLQDSQGVRPNGAAIEKALAAYQSERIDRMMEIFKFSSEITKSQAWANKWYKFLALWVVPFLPKRTFGDLISGIISRGPKLDFVEVGAGFPSGRMPFINDEHLVAKEIQPNGVVRNLLAFMSRLGWIAGFMA